MARENFHPKPGETVRIREWDDMKREFGGTDAAIPCKFGFIGLMSELCGREFVISRISGDHVIGHDFGYSISIDMIEYPDSDDLGDSYEEIDSFLGGMVIS